MEVVRQGRTGVPEGGEDFPARITVEKARSYLAYLAETDKVVSCPAYYHSLAVATASLDKA